MWRLDDEGPLPGSAYVVFPGNAGMPETLLDIVSDFLDVATAYRNASGL